MDTNKKVNKTLYAKKYTLTIDKVLSLMEKRNVFVYDLRPKSKFDLKHILGSENIKFDKIKEKILEHNYLDKIIIVGAQERSYSVIVTWARKNWYFRTFVLANGMDNIKKKQLKK